ncbi:MAG: DNA polymerase I [Lachnospiraceae bacterium]|nr:DNA polymerase I [Lachnospiraceae bacterium]
MDDYFLIIDGSSLLSTQYYGNLPREVLMGRTQEEREANYKKIMHTGAGVYTNGVYGFLRSLFKIISTMPPKYLAVTWDLTRDTFRRELYPDYKGNRGETPYPLKDQFALCQRVLSEIGVKQFMDTHYEADDFSGTLCKRFEADTPIRILTKDHDYLQLVNDKVSVFLLQSAQKKADELLKKYHMDASVCPEKCFLMTEETVLGEEGVKPASIAHLKALQGDSSDNIKGVPGIGPQTAVALIGKYETVESLYEAIDAAGANTDALFAEWKLLGIKQNPIGKLTKKDDETLTGRDAAELSLKLATIKTDIPIDETLEDLTLNLSAEGIDKVLHELEFASLTPPTVGMTKSVLTELTAEWTVAEDFDTAEALCKKIFASKENAYGILYDKASGELYLAGAKEAFRFVPDGFFLTEEYLSSAAAKIAEKADLYALDGKSLTGLFENPPSRLYDLSVCDYLLRPLTGSHGAKDLQMEYAPNVLFSDGNEAVTLLLRNIGETVLNKLSESGMTELYKTIEHPMIWVLADMEKTGIYADPALLKKLSAEFTERLEAEEKTIYEMAGTTFNINSPKQLGEVLFERMKLPGGKKTKTGYSTAADVLERMSEDQPIVKHILTYRQYGKLKSVYAEGLQNFIAEDGRIHTTFRQTVTATGRLSSTDPNLQNIPIRTEEGREIRKVFLPKPGCLFLDADYSQIELRLMAHMSGDEALIGAYRNAEDIHRMTASQVFHVPYEKVTGEQRSAAKAVNFGILYGISSFGLGQNLGISRKTAEEYIKAYYERYPAMKRYLEENVRLAKEQGYVKTLFGRIRPIPELSGGNFQERAFGERVAMNSPIQGTAADIMKIAMLRIARMLREQKLRSKMLVQVHDEILVETYPEEEAAVYAILKEAMEGAAELSVPLVADIHRGFSWYEAK